MTEPHHWTDGQVERMNRTLQKAAVKRYHYETHDRLRSHLAHFVSACNFGRRLKTLRGLTRTNTSARHGHSSQRASSSTQSIKCRGQTAKPPQPPRAPGSSCCGPPSARSALQTQNQSP